MLIAAFERLQPYHRRKRVHNDWLWVLEELWNGDKHHAVSVVLAYTALKHLYIIPPWIISNRAVSHKRGREVQDGTEITRMEFVWICTRRNQNYDPRMDVSAEFAMDVTFDPRSPIGRRRVVPVLLLIEKNVRSIVRKFRKCL